MTKRTVTLTVDADDELLLRPIKAALLSDTGATFEDADVYAVALRWMAYGRGPSVHARAVAGGAEFLPGRMRRRDDLPRQGADSLPAVPGI